MILITNFPLQNSVHISRCQKTKHSFILGRPFNKLTTHVRFSDFVCMWRRSLTSSTYKDRAGL